MSDKFVWSDAWILLALLYAGDKAERATISSIADGIDHSIPTDEELDEAFTRLSAEGLIENKAGRFTATDRTKEAYLRTHTPRRTVSKELDDIKRFLGITPN
ncbi:hypothetical protein EON83_22370 [bacterium]|nr:MAG: hypothetical protein EON83_22370 [bacterium]